MPAFIALVVILVVVIIGSCSAVFYLLREEATTTTTTATNADRYAANRATPPTTDASDDQTARRWYKRLAFFSPRKQGIPGDDETHQIRSGAGNRSRGWVQSTNSTRREWDLDSTTTTTMFSPAPEKVKEKISATSMTHTSGLSIDSRVQSPRSSLGPVSYIPPTRASLYSEPALSVDLEDPSAVAVATRSMHSPEPRRPSFVVFRPPVYSPPESPTSRPMTSMEPLISAPSLVSKEDADDDLQQPFSTRSGEMVRTPVIGSKFIESL